SRLVGPLTDQDGVHPVHVTGAAVTKWRHRACSRHQPLRKLYVAPFAEAAGDVTGIPQITRVVVCPNESEPTAAPAVPMVLVTRHITICRMGRTPSAAGTVPCFVLRRWQHAPVRGRRRTRSDEAIPRPR